jgi:hypothetical protein
MNDTINVNDKNVNDKNVNDKNANDKNVNDKNVNDKNVIFFKCIDILPYELLDIIYEYVPTSITMFLTKDNYIKNHHLIRKYIDKTKIEKYIRTMIHQDNDFVFNFLLVENHQRWLNMTKYYYQEYIYSNYLHFLDCFALENEAVKCRNLIVKYKNQHRKKLINKYKWNN